MKFGLPEKELGSILSEINVHLGSTTQPKIFIYGSRVKGNAREFSDIDILLKAEFYDKKSLAHIDFSELDTVYKVDFVLDEDLYEGYREEIYRHMVQIA